jgi:2Fe-2S ferredoxin
MRLDRQEVYAESVAWRSDMPTVYFIDADGRRETVDAAAGQSLMRAAVDHGIDGIAADCGGCLSCATCHVYLHAEWLERLPAMSADEAAMLETTAAERRPNSRLSCQIVVDDNLHGLVVDLPPTQY